jgi:hypothetical protein
LERAAFSRARANCPIPAPARQHARQPRGGSDLRPPRPAPWPFSRSRDHPPDVLACVARIRPAHPSRRRPLPDRAGCYRPSYLTIGWHRSMSAVRLRSMTMALTAPPSWQILTRRSTVVSDRETVNGPLLSAGRQARAKPPLYG